MKKRIYLAAMFVVSTAIAMAQTTPSSNSTTNKQATTTTVKQVPAQSATQSKPATATQAAPAKSTSTATAKNSPDKKKGTAKKTNKKKVAKPVKAVAPANTNVSPK